MATDFKSIPIIDVSPLLDKWDHPNISQDQGAAEVIKQLDQACREAGFFYVKGHGIPDSLMQEVRHISHVFFDQPHDTKLKIKLSAATGYRGYQWIGQNITKGEPDMHEAIDRYKFFGTTKSGKLVNLLGWRKYALVKSPYALEVIIKIICYKEVKDGMYGGLGEVMKGSNKWPGNPPDFARLMEEYINFCTDLSRKIMRGIALALGGSVDEIERERAGDPFWVLRIIGYPGASSSSGQDVQKNDIGCGAHTDYGLLTLVNQDDDITALQVKNRSGEWISAPPIPGTFVCNIGDMLQILSNGLYESTLHRVMNKSLKYRVAVAYFYEPNFDALIEPLEVCKQQTGGLRNFEGAVYGKHLVDKVTTNFVA